MTRESKEVQRKETMTKLYKIELDEAQSLQTKTYACVESDALKKLERSLPTNARIRSLVPVNIAHESISKIEARESCSEIRFEGGEKWIVVDRSLTELKDYFYPEKTAVEDLERRVARLERMLNDQEGGKNDDNSIQDRIHKR